MAGTIKLRFTTQALDFPPYTRGRVQIKFQDPDGVSHDLDEALVQSAPQAYQFQEVPWQSGLQASLDYGQATNFANAFNRDYKNLGGTKNLAASVVNNEVTITATRGTFLSGANYNGDVLIIAIDPPSNTADPTIPTLTVANAGTGSCSVINYNVSAVGDGPFRLVVNGLDQITGWDGLSTTIALARGQVSKIFVEDTDGDLSDPINVNVPRQLDPANFNAVLTPASGSADLTVEWPAPVSGVTPLEYSLTATSAVVAGTYQSSNVFPGVLDGTYKLWIRDVYGCEITKTVTVVGYADANNGSTLKYFRISDFNSLSFSRRTSGRKNYDTALSFEEAVGLPKKVYFEFTEGDEIQTQFKSSFPFHQITLFKCNGSKEDLNFLEIQQNIGVAEKVDCRVFQLSTTQTGVYFTGGNLYTPGTATVIGTSPYSSGLPSWAEVGQFVVMGTLGTREIKSIGFDEDLGVLYFVVDGYTAATADDTVQATYNRHDYNLFRCDFPMSKVSERAFVRIEAGYSSDEIEVVYQSETIRRITDTSKHLKIQWSGFKNLGDMIFVDGYQGIMWVKGRVRPTPIGTAKNYEGTDEVYPLVHTQRIGQRVSIPLMTPKQWAKFGLISAIAEGGTLLIEDMQLVRESAIEAEELGDSNYSNVECEFAYTGDGLNEVTGEVVLNPSTGTVGGGGTGKIPTGTTINLLRLSDGTFVRFSDGSWLAVG